MWRNGFTVDDGPLRPFNDPQSMAFLAALNEGYRRDHQRTGRARRDRCLTCPPLASLARHTSRVPPELGAKPGQKVSIALKNQSEEDYKPQAKPLKAFSGQGQRLGSVDPDAPPSVVAEAFKPGGSGAAAAPAAAPAATAAAPAVAAANANAPMTSIQLRLADGTRYGAADAQREVARPVLRQRLQPRSGWSPRQDGRAVQPGPDGQRHPHVHQQVRRALASPFALFPGS